jgi:glycosyltransferase involved in cell wall biosynthesis
MTINFFLQSKDFGGAEKFAHDLILEIAGGENQVFLYTSNDFLLKSLADHQNINVEKIPIYLDFTGNRKGLLKSLLLAPLAKIYYLKTLLKIKKRPSRQVILCSGFSEKIIVVPMARLFNLPVFFIEYGPLSPIFNKLYGIPKFLYYLSKNFAKKVIVPSKNTRLSLKYIFEENRMVLIPCGSSSPSLNQKNKIKKNSIILISRLEEGKGQDLAIKAFALVKKEFRDAELLIVGQGSFEEELKKLSNNDPQIKFLKYITNKQDLIEQSEIVLCPSVWPLEGFGLTIIEAMALGKPIVAFDRAPGNEMISNGESAILAKNGDHLDLAKAIIRLLKDKNLQEKLAKNAKEDFEAKYKIEKIAEQYLDLLQN